MKGEAILSCEASGIRSVKPRAAARGTPPPPHPPTPPPPGPCSWRKPRLSRRRNGLCDVPRRDRGSWGEMEMNIWQAASPHSNCIATSSQTGDQFRTARPPGDSVHLSFCLLGNRLEVGGLSLKKLKSRLTQEGRGSERKSVRKGGPLRHQLPQLPALSCWRSGVPVFAMYDAHFFFCSNF